MEKVKKVWKRIRGLVAASGQLRVGLVLFALVLLVVLFAPQLAPFDPYDLGDDLLVPPEFRGIGVRIEDDVVVNADGTVTRISEDIPRTIADVEEWIASVQGR